MTAAVQRRRDPARDVCRVIEVGQVMCRMTSLGCQLVTHETLPRPGTAALPHAVPRHIATRRIFRTETFVLYYCTVFK